MAQTNQDITINTEWVNVNQVTGIPVGTPFQLQNKGSNDIVIQEASTAPAQGTKDGFLLTTVNYGNALANVSSGSLTLWARTFDDDGSKLATQVV